MPYYDNKADWIAHLRESWETASEYVDFAFTKIGIAETEWWLPDDHSALGWVIYCLFDLIEAVANINEFWEDPDRKFALLEYGEQYYATTWQSIVEAWIADDFEGRAYTIATIDKMREIIWNEPFEITWAANIGQQEVS